MTTDEPSRTVLEDLYRKAAYWIEQPEPLLLTIDTPEPLLDGLLERLAVAHAAILTASNPGSRLLSLAENERAHRRLLDRLPGRGRDSLPVRATDPGGLWPDEIGLLVPGITLDLARRLAREFGQNAFVWCHLRQPPRLVWT